MYFFNIFALIKNTLQDFIVLIQIKKYVLYTITKYQIQGLICLDLKKTIILSIKLLLF